MSTRPGSSDMTAATTQPEATSPGIQLTELLAKFGEMASEMATQRKLIDELISSGVQPEPVPDRQPEPESFVIPSTQVTDTPSFPIPPEETFAYPTTNLPYAYPPNPSSFLTRRQGSQPQATSNISPELHTFYYPAAEPFLPDHTVQTKPEMGESSTPVDMKLLKRLDRFDEFMGKSQGLNKQGVLDYDKFCLLPNVRLPERFKTPKFNKYDRTGNVSALESQLDALQGQRSSGKKQQFQKKEGEIVFVWDRNRVPRSRPRQHPTYSNSYPYHSNPHPVHHPNTTQPRPRPKYTNSSIAPFQISQPNFQQVRPRPPYNQQFSPPNRPTYNYPQHTKIYNQSRTRTFTNLGRPLDQLYEQLKAAGRIGIILPPTYSHGVPAGYNPQYTCAYHSGAPGHPTTDCRALKHKVQDMIEAGEIVIREGPAQAPNVDKNPLPEYDNTIGVIMDHTEFKEPTKNSSSEAEVFGNDAEFPDIPEGSISN
ncbi:uncharacterized protein [Coffea arabica]|uniref:Uncharacterized protein n=1 Tax=Coffea arabica TaxID=13443 RepID=A0A6P6S9H7_COFAR